MRFVYWLYTQGEAALPYIVKAWSELMTFMFLGLVWYKRYTQASRHSFRSVKRRTVSQYTYTARHTGKRVLAELVTVASVQQALAMERLNNTLGVLAQVQEGYRVTLYPSAV